MEWARKLTAADIAVLQGKGDYCEKLPDVDDGFTAADLKDPAKRDAIFMVVQERWKKAMDSHPNGYLVRHAPAEDLAALQQLGGHLQVGQFITKFRKSFTRGEMNEDLLLIPARVGDHTDTSEYEEILPTSPP